MAKKTMDELKKVGYRDSQGNWRSFVNNYNGNPAGYTDSQGNWRGAPPAPNFTNRGGNGAGGGAMGGRGPATNVRPRPQTNYNRDAIYQESVRKRNEMLNNMGLDSKGNPLNVGGTTTVAPGNGMYQRPAGATTNYDWGDGSQYLSPDNPLVRPVVYDNEFSADRTMSVASDVYNKYYAPIVEEQQEQVTQKYRDTAQEAAATAGAAGMATGSRGAIQLANQANREANQANLQYQQQMQLQAFQDTINARNLELQNKIQDYQNAWQEVSQYGYVVTEGTGKLLGIQPGQQLTTQAYKTTMSNIAKNVADINAQKVQLGQQQQQLDQEWVKFQESIRQYEKSFAEGQRQFNLGHQLERDKYEMSKQSTKLQNDQFLYQRLIDMLNRYDTVTPEMVSLGNMVGMRLNLNDNTKQYLSAAERLVNNQANYGANGVPGNQYYNDMNATKMLINQYLPYVQSSGKIGNSTEFATVLTQWQAQGVSPEQAEYLIKKKQDVDINGQKYNLGSIIGKAGGARDEAIKLVYQVLGNSQNNYGNYLDRQNISNLKRIGMAGTIGMPGLPIGPLLYWNAEPIYNSMKNRFNKR